MKIKFNGFQSDQTDLAGLIAINIWCAFVSIWLELMFARYIYSFGIFQGLIGIAFYLSLYDVFGDLINRLRGSKKRFKKVIEIKW